MIETSHKSARQDSVVRSAGIVSMSVATSRITGLVRERVMAGLFGAGLQYDAFVLGFRIPNLTRDLFAEGALSSAFVPVFTEYLSKRDKKEAAALANMVASALIVIVGTVCLLGVILSPLLVSALAPGFKDVPGKYELAVRMTRIMFPFLLLVALAAQAMGILNACGQFAVPAMSSTFFNIGSLAGGLSLGRWLGPMLGFSLIEGMAWGVVFGGAIQLAWQVPALRRAGFGFHLLLDWKDSGLQRILRMMGPAILGNAAVQINVAVNTSFASQISDPIRGQDGPVSWLGYAFRFIMLPIGLFGVAIGSATLPAISRSAAAAKMDDFRSQLARSLGLVFVLTIPSSIGLAVLGEAIVGAIYQVGHFDFYDTQQTAIALSCYSLGLAGYSAVKVLTPAFYALNDSRTPMVVSLGSIAINLAVATSLVFGVRLGHSGLALSTSAVAMFSSIAQFWVMRARVGGLHEKELLQTLIRVTTASVVMGVVAVVVSRGIQHVIGIRPAARLVELGITIPISILVFYFVGRLLRISELEQAMAAVAGPIRRRLGRARN